MGVLANPASMAAARRQRVSSEREKASAGRFFDLAVCALLLDVLVQRDALDVVDIRFFHPGKKLSGVRTEAFDVASLAFSVQCIER